MSLNDTFDRHDGDLVGYSLNTIGTTLPSRRHYDIRTFTDDSMLFPWTMMQMELWNADHFEDFSVEELEDGFPDPGLSEGWINATSVGPNASHRYGNVLVRNVSVGTPQTVTSPFVDDLLTDFEDDQYIELVLRDFPSQVAAARFDLATSFIDFTSDYPGFAAGSTDSIRFNQSATSLTGGGNLVFRIDRDLLTTVDLKNVTGIRFRLTAAGAGTATFKASAMRMRPQSGWTYEEIDIETKRKILTRSVPEDGDPEHATSFGFVYWNDLRPIDNSFEVRFHNGTNPSVGNYNKFTLAFRYSDSDLDSHRVVFTSNEVESQISIEFHDGTTGIPILTTPSATNALDENTDYVLRVDLDHNLIRARIWSVEGPFLRVIQYETGWTTMLNDVRNGYVGYSFEPYFYDFYLHYVGSSYVEFGHFESTVFESNKHVLAATLIEHSSKNIDVFEDVGFESHGDTNSLVTAGNTYTVTRGGSSWTGGIVTAITKHIGDSRYAEITGEILPASTPRGQYRIVIKDIHGQAVWISVIPLTVANQWQSFRLFVKKRLLPDEYSVEIHQAGFYVDSFKVRNFKLSVDSVAWYGSNNGGTNYYPFLNAINGEYTALNFPKSSNELRVKGFVTHGDGWIQGYKLKPIYGYKDGFYNEEGATDLVAISTELDVRVTGAGDDSELSTDIRITGISGVAGMQLPLIFNPGEGGAGVPPAGPASIPILINN